MTRRYDRYCPMAHALNLVGERWALLVVLELMPHDETWVRDRLGHRHLGFQPEALERTLRDAGFDRPTLEVHPRQASSPFRVFLLTGEKR